MAAVAAASVFALLGAPPAAAQARVIDVIDVDGVIDPVSSRFLERQIDRAEDEGSHAIIVRLDTPGGLDISMREMVQRILGARLPVVVWVGPSGARAASAGVFVTYASHIAAMAPATNLGAAHPVNLGGETDEVSAEKAVEDAANYIVSIARQRGRNVEFAEDSVRESASIDAESAVDEDVVDLLAATINQLLDEIDGRTVELLDEAEGSRQVTLRTEGAQVVFHDMSLLERILHAVVRPEIAFMLMILGFYGLIFELYNPGIGAAGVLGGIALILGFYALSVLPTSWAGVALIVLAVAFYLVDLHIAGLGVFTVGGTVALIAGGLLLFAGADPSLRLAWWAIGGAVAGSLVFFISIMTAALKARLSKPVSGAEALVDTVGIARTDIAPEGQVLAKGTLWRARTVGVAIGEGSPVKILGSSGLTLMVEEAPEGMEEDMDETAKG